MSPLTSKARELPHFVLTAEMAQKRMGPFRYPTEILSEQHLLLWFLSRPSSFCRNLKPTDCSVSVKTG